MIFLSSTPVKFALRAEQIGFGITRRGSTHSTGQERRLTWRSANHKSQLLFPSFNRLGPFTGDDAITIRKGISVIVPRHAQPRDVSPDGSKRCKSKAWKGLDGMEFVRQSSPHLLSLDYISTLDSRNSWSCSHQSSLHLLRHSLPDRQTLVERSSYPNGHLAQ